MRAAHQAARSIGRGPVIHSGRPAEVVHIRERGGVSYRVDKRSFFARLMSFIRREVPTAGGRR